MARMDFSDIDKKFADAPTDSDDITTPDGIYRAIIKGAGFRWTKGNRPERIFIWTLMIVEGSYAENTIEKASFLRDDSMKWFKIDLKRCGWNAHSLSEVYDDSERLIGLELEIKLETKNGRQNCWFRKLLEPGEHDPEGPPPLDDKDMPF